MEPHFFINNFTTFKFNIPVVLVLALLLIHFVMDFMCQADAWAKGKSSDNWILTLHVSVYILPFLLFFGWKYAVFNFAAHWITDYFSSRASKKLFAKGDVHNGFVVIGADQLIHYTCLLFSIPLMAVSP